MKKRNQSKSRSSDQTAASTGHLPTKKKRQPGPTQFPVPDPTNAGDSQPVFPYRPDIDGLRAIAVILVMFFHAFPNLFPGGYIGVDIFFVISGYLITGIIGQEIGNANFSFADFYARRCVRILPALFIVTLSVLAAGIITMLPDELVNLGEHLTASAGFFSNFLIYSETGYFAAVADEKPLLHLWSLAIEEQFYLIWPLVLVAAASVKFARTPIAVILLIATLGASIWIVDASNQHALGFFMLHTRLWELAAGGILALNETRLRQFLKARPRIRPHLLLSGLGLALALTTTFAFSKATPYPGWHAILPVLSAVLVIVGGMALPAQGLLSSRSLVFIGLISYPLYLWHWPILAFLRISITEPGVQAKLLAIGLAFLLAWQTRNLLEQPIRRMVRLRQIRAAKVITAGVGILVLIGALGLLTQKGMIQRPGGQATDSHTFYNFLSKMPYPGMSFEPDTAAVKLDNSTLSQFVNAYRKYDVQAIYRADKCNVSVAKPIPAPECLALPTQRQPTIFLWGDSHAEHLYPGLQALYGNSVSILQVTSSGCPPVPAMRLSRQPACFGANDLAIKNIVVSRPDIVVISAIWEDYLKLPKFEEGLLGAIDAIKAAGVKHVVLIGDTPSWYPTLYQILARSGKIGENRPNYLFQPYLRRMKSGEGRMMELERKSRAFVYISLIDRLCRTDDCVIRVGPNDNEDLITFDYGHLTKSGSEYVVKNILARELDKYFQVRK